MRHPFGCDNATLDENNKTILKLGYEEEDNFFTSPCFFPFSLAHVTVVILILTQVIVKDEKKKWKCNQHNGNRFKLVPNFCKVFYH